MHTVNVLDKYKLKGEESEVSMLLIYKFYEYYSRPENCTYRGDAFGERLQSAMT